MRSFNLIETDTAPGSRTVYAAREQPIQALHIFIAIVRLKYIRLYAIYTI